MLPARGSGCPRAVCSTSVRVTDEGQGTKCVAALRDYIAALPQAN